MNNKQLYEELINMDKEDVLNTISIMIEFYSNVYETDFYRVIKHLKKTHRYLEKQNNS